MPEQDTTDDDFDVELEDKGFEQAPTALFMPDGDEPKVPDGAVRCYLVLRYMGATKNFRMSRAKIAQAMGVTDRSVRTYLTALEGAGWILRTPVYAQTDRRGERPGRIQVLWKRATVDQIREHQRKVDALLAEHKAQTEARKAEPIPFRRRRTPAGTRKGSSGHGRKESSGLARKESSGHGVKESSGHDAASPQVRGPVSEGYPHLSTQTSTTQTSTNHTSAERGVHEPSPSVTREDASNDQVSAVEGTRSARPDGPGRVALERVLREKGIQTKALRSGRTG